METRIVAVSRDPAHPDFEGGSDALKEKLCRPAQCIRAGGTVIFPTETVYGLGASALDSEALAKIYAAKGRPSDNPLIAHISDMDMLGDLVATLPQCARALIHAFWPGPLTLIFPKNPALPAQLTGGLDTVAVRMPNHPVAQLLIRLAGVPVAAPSANLSGRPSPTEFSHAARDLMGRVDWIIDGGATTGGLESTVLDITGAIPVILRPGAITQEDVIGVVGACALDPTLDSGGDASSGAFPERAGHPAPAPRAPGMKYRHYAPEAHTSVCVGTDAQVIHYFSQRIETVLRHTPGATPDAAPAPVNRMGIAAFSGVIQALHSAYGTRVQLKSYAGGTFTSQTGTEGDIRGDGEADDKTDCGSEDTSIRPVILLDLGDAQGLAAHLYRMLRDVDAMGCAQVWVQGVEPTGIGAAIMNRLSKASEGRIVRI